MVEVEMVKSKIDNDENNHPVIDKQEIEPVKNKQAYTEEKKMKDQIFSKKS